MQRSVRAVLLLLSLSAPVAAQSRPNIIFVLADDHAAHAVSAYRAHLDYGARLPATPNIDRIAQTGMLFRDAFVTNSICAPARATILTGLYGHINGVMTNGDALHPVHETFPQLLRSGGYATAVVGKWHLRTAPAGFDYYEVLAGQGPYYNPVLSSSPTDSVRYDGYTTDIITDRALRWLDSRRDASAPFLLMLNYNATHRYWDPGPDELLLYRDTLIAEPVTLWDDGSGRTTPASDPEMTLALDLFDRDLKFEAPANLTPAQLAAWRLAYDAENSAFRLASMTPQADLRWRYQRYISDYMRIVASLDRSVGRLLDRLERSGLNDNTIVVYTSDQGFFLGDHGWFDKRWMYEESLRTPLLVRWPAVISPGSVNRNLVMNIDIAQTLLEVGGVTAPQTMQGRSLVPLLRGHTPRDWRDAIYYQYFEYPGWHMVKRQYGVRTQRYKLIHFYEHGSWELFDLDRDPDEMRSVYADPGYADVVSSLKRRLSQLRSEYAVPATDPVPHRPFEPGPGMRRPPEKRVGG